MTEQIPLKPCPQGLMALIFGAFVSRFGAVGCLWAAMKTPVPFWIAMVILMASAAFWNLADAFAHEADLKEKAITAWNTRKGEDHAK